MAKQKFDIRTGVTLSNEVLADIEYLETVFACNRSAVIRMAVSIVAAQQRKLN